MNSSCWPELRDNGKPNRWHEFEEDPETQMCVICGWAEQVHTDSTAAPPADPPALIPDLNLAEIEEYLAAGEYHNREDWGNKTLDCAEPAIRALLAEVKRLRAAVGARRQAVPSTLEDELRDFATRLSAAQKPLSPECAKVLRENIWELITEAPPAGLGTGATKEQD